MLPFPESIQSGFETWRYVPSYPWYEVSSLGRIRTTKGHPRGRHRVIRSHRAWRGYQYVNLLHPGGDTKLVAVHLLVGEAFLGVTERLVHVDKNKANNAAKNLRPARQKDHPLRRGRPRGTGKKLDALQRDLLADAIQRGKKTNKELAEEFKISPSYVTKFAQARGLNNPCRRRWTMATGKGSVRCPCCKHLFWVDRASTEARPLVLAPTTPPTKAEKAALRAKYGPSES